MSAASSVLSEDQFLCSICLDVFTDPVSTPCGHNFCKKCITDHWDINVPYECPLCKMLFYIRPELQVNTFISEMVAHFRQSAQQETSSSSSEQQAAKPGEVPCDICTGIKVKALKSCLVCLVSYCETHLEPHLTASGLKKHQLINPAKNLEKKMCVKHDKLLELFCKDDQSCVCMLCSILDHKVHDVVPLEEEYEGKKAELGKTEAELQQMIQERQQKIKEMKHSVKVSRENADREIANGVQLLTNMTDALERHQVQVIRVIEEKHKTTKRQADSFIRELEQEISELKKRSAELKQLSRSEDHLNLLQNFSSLNAAPPTRDWTEVRVCPPLYLWNVRKAVIRLSAILKNEMKLVSKSELKVVQQYAVDVTLDPDTAHKKLILSEDGKQVHHGGTVKRNLPDNSGRFSAGACVLGKQTVSSRRIYFEVQVTGKTGWVLGVARESINRKEVITIRPENGYWTLCLKNENIFLVSTDPPVRLPLELKPEKVGVFVDYEEGLVTFYDADTANLLYIFTGCSFTEKLLPFFSPFVNQGGKNSAPLIICPVNPAK